MTNFNDTPDPVDQTPTEIPQPPQDRVVKGDNEIGDRINSGDSTRGSLNQG